MIKNLKLLPLRTIILLILCLAGVAAAAVWSWSVGPITQNGSVGAAVPAAAQTVSGVYPPAGQAGQNSQVQPAGSPVSPPANTTPLAAPEVMPAPIPVCKYSGGAQPDGTFCPFNCQSSSIDPCGCRPGVEIACRAVE